MPVAQVVAAQAATSTVLYRLAYNDNTFAYKLAATTARDPRIIVLGTSRAMQFRREFFAEPDSFYNAGGMHDAADYLNFVRALPEGAQLDTVILNVEPVFLTTESPPTTGRQDTTRYALVLNFLASGWREAYLDLFSGKVSIGKLMSESSVDPAIGIAALMTSTGFRNDGSYQPESESDAARASRIDSQVAYGLEKIASNNAGLGSRVAIAPLAQFKQTLALLHERGINVVGFIPPIAQEEHDALLASDTEYAKIQRTASRLFAAMFIEYGYPLYDVSSLATTGSSDAELIDDGHGSEKTYLRILLYMAGHDSALRRFVDRASVAPLLATSSPIKVIPE